VSRSSAPAVLPRTARGQDGAGHPSLPLPSIPVPRLASDEDLDVEQDDDPPAPGGRRLRLPRPPGKRAPLWLAALVVGALLAAVPTVFGSGPSPVASAADYGLGVAGDAGVDAGMDANMRQGITEAEARQRLNALAASRADREPKTVLPTQGYLSTCFCMRWGTMHWGIDLAAPLGTPIVAATDGVVLRAGPASGFGNAVYLEDADGDVEVYGHMRYYFVHAGQTVHAGDLIAKVGSEGESTGPHLHFQVDHHSEYGDPIDPVPWFAARGVHVPGT
jgi:murein DD-endopeptidase MepM/ murein hydrolase activator NlpD